MVKAHITMKDGSTILIDGTAEEVAKLMARFDGGAAGAATHEKPSVRRRSDSRKGKSATKSAGKSKVTATTLIDEMIEAGFFKKPKVLAEIKAEMERSGHYFSNSGVSVPVLRAVRKRNLRRLDKDGAWTYVV